MDVAEISRRLQAADANDVEERLSTNRRPQGTVTAPCQIAAGET
jgi:hypothetical protein